MLQISGPVIILCFAPAKLVINYSYGNDLCCLYDTVAMWRLHNSIDTKQLRGLQITLMTQGTLLESTNHIEIQESQLLHKFSNSPYIINHVICISLFGNQEFTRIKFRNHISELRTLRERLKI